MEVERVGVEQHHAEIAEQAASARKQLLLEKVLGPPRRRSTHSSITARQPVHSHSRLETSGAPMRQPPEPSAAFAAGCVRLDLIDALCRYSVRGRHAARQRRPFLAAHKAVSKGTMKVSAEVAVDITQIL